MAEKKSILVSCAWPYANGSLHVGHIAALLPADILVRYYTLQDHRVLFVSGTDAHGTPITVRAYQEHKKPEEIAQHYHAEFSSNFDQLGFSFKTSGFYSITTSREHQKLVQEIFLKLYKNGYIEKRTSMGYWSTVDKRFLPDRYIEGECPYCHFNSARGDQCDNCGRLLDPKDLINPKSKLSGDAPIEKETEHFYFLLSKLEKKIKSYISSTSHIRSNTKSFTEQYMKQGLQDRAITRDLEWGIPVPLDGYESKRIYVWFEAVCGYLSASVAWAQSQKNPNAWKEFWFGKEILAYYVYGKDNIPFHTIIWPAILCAYDKTLHLPDIHVASEYVQIEGKKLSTSRGWAVWIPDLLRLFSQDAIRFALISFGPETSDTNFSYKEFQGKFNNEFVATLGNYIQRVLKLAQKIGVKKVEKSLSITNYEPVFRDVESHILEGRFRDALNFVIRYAADGNKRIDYDAPWKILKTNPKQAAILAEKELRYCVQFIPLLAPFLPTASDKLQKIFNIKLTSFKPIHASFGIKEIPDILFPKIEDDAINKAQEKLKSRRCI